MVSDKHGGTLLAGCLLGLTAAAQGVTAFSDYSPSPSSDIPSQGISSFLSLLCLPPLPSVFTPPPSTPLLVP